MLKVGVVGGTGYTAGELIRTLLHHPNVEIDFVYSHSKPGEKIGSVHQDLMYESIVFTDQVNENVDVLFLCLGHGNSKKFIQKYTFGSGTKIIDLSNDFRLEAGRSFLGRNYTYGLIEANKQDIQSAEAIANPGCFATAIQLALLPLANSKSLNGDIHIHAITGATGAGATKSETTHFAWRNNNVSIYKLFNHQHLGEITETITTHQPEFDSTIHFVPMRGDFSRGILASVYTKTDLPEDELLEMYKSFYKDSKFTKVVDGNVHLKQVVNTNYCFIQVQRIGDQVHITSVIDNLHKGAAGQAIENMNLLFDLPQDAGLKLKANYF